MNRTLLLATLSLVLMLCYAAESRGGSIIAPITYNIQNYASLQNGYTLSGTITTDGTIGTLVASNITSFSFTISNAGGTIVDQENGTIAKVENLTATLTMLTLSDSNPISQLRLPPVIEDPIEYIRSPGFGVYQAFGNNQSFWEQNSEDNPGFSLGGDPWVIAVAASTVPEPGSLTLALLGGTCLAVVRWARCRYRTHAVSQTIQTALS